MAKFELRPKGDFLYISHKTQIDLTKLSQKEMKELQKKFPDLFIKVPKDAEPSADNK